MAVDNKTLGRFELVGIPPAPRGVPQIEVTFDINVDGLLSVTAKENESGKEQSVTIQGSSNLSETDIDTMLEEAEKYASLDKEKRENIDLKNQAEALCFEAEKELDLLKDKISNEQQDNVKNLIEKIREDIKIENFESLKSIVDELKLAMKNMVDETQSMNDSMGDLNDL